MKLSRRTKLFGGGSNNDKTLVDVENNNIEQQQQNEKQKTNCKRKSSPLKNGLLKLSYRTLSSSAKATTTPSPSLQEQIDDVEPEKEEQLEDQNKNNNNTEKEIEVEDIMNNEKDIVDADVDADISVEEVHPVEEQLQQEQKQPHQITKHDNIVEGTKRLFKPPKEVTIDPHAVPPSPMRDPFQHLPHNMLPNDGDEDNNHNSGGVLLNFDPTTQQHYIQKRNLFSSSFQDDNYCIGDPLGDIAMKRQLLDAQRLVRLILGKPLGGDQPLLETSTILQAIRSFAMMKQELIELRKRQEEQDGDPPAILQSLASPATTTTPASATTITTTATRNLTNPTNIFSFQKIQEEDRDGEENNKISLNGSSTSSPILTFDDNSNYSDGNNNTESKMRIEWLEQQLKAANETVLKLQEEKNQQPKSVIEPISSLQVPGEEQQEANNVLDDNSNDVQERKYKQLEAKYMELVQRHEAAVEESKKNLLDVVEEVASVPKRVLAKDTVREKLKAYCKTITYHASQVQIMEIESRMHREREESERRIQELQNQLRIQQDAHQRKIQEWLQSKEEPLSPKEPLSSIGCNESSSSSSSDNVKENDVPSTEEENLTKQSNRIPTIQTTTLEVDLMQDEKKVDW
jgi:hypothetical protein